MDDNTSIPAFVMKLEAPDWNHWRPQPTAMLWELALLTLNVEPHYCWLNQKGLTDLFNRRMHRQTIKLEQDLADRLNLAIRNLTPDGKLEPILRDVEARPGTFTEEKNLVSRAAKFAEQAQLKVRVADFVAVFGDAWPELHKLEAAGNADHPLAGWEGFDQTAENYPPELDIALQAWRHVTVNDAAGAGKNPAQRLRAYLDRMHPKLSTEAKNRITRVANWDRRGGRAKRNG